MDKYIQIDLADRFGQVYSNRFSQRIWTSIFKQILPKDLEKYIQTYFAKGFERRVQTDLADQFGQVYRKISNVSPGLIEVFKHFLGGLIFGGAYIRRAFCVSVRVSRP